MLELSGVAAIAGVLIGSVLMALFLGEALVNLVIRAMSAGVKRADQAAAKLQGKPAPAPRLLSGQRQRLQRI